MLILAGIALTAGVRLRLAGVALERDEGEYAYAGQLILEGVPPYKLAYNMKPPGIYGAYAVIMAAFGQSPSGIHLGLLLINAATALTVFLLGRRLFDPLTGALAGAAYALLSASQSVLGPFAHASHFLLLPSLAGVLLVLRGIESGRSGTFFGAGLLLGLALLMKQHAVFFLMFAAAHMAWVQLVAKTARLPHPLVSWGALAVGASLPPLTTGILLVLAGTFGRFWFWTVQYAREYVSEVSLAQALQIFPDAVAQVAEPSVLIWGLAAIGLAALFFDERSKRARAFLLFFFLFSFLAVCPGFYFRNHYFIVLLPAIAMLSAAGSVWIGRAVFAGAESPSAALLALLVFGIAAGAFVYAQRDFFFRMDLREVSRSTYGGNPFVESVEIGQYIKSHTAPGETIAVIGSEPQIYFYSGRHSATGYIYTYGLMEEQKFASKMQDEMIGEIEAAHPKYLVMVSVSTSWLVRRSSEPKIFRWSERFLAERYELCGIADIVSKEKTEYRWDAAVAGYKPQGPAFVTVFRRRS